MEMTSRIPTLAELAAPIDHAYPAARAHLPTNAYQHGTKNAALKNEMPASSAQEFVPAADNVETGYVKLYPLRRASGLHDLSSIPFRKSSVVPPPAVTVSARPRPYPLPRTSRQLDSGPSILFKQSDVMLPQRFANPIEVSVVKPVWTTVNRSYPEIFHQENVSPETQVSKPNPNGPLPGLLKHVPKHLAVSQPHVYRVQLKTLPKPLTARIISAGNSRIENTDESFKSIKPRSVKRLIDFWENE
jgi:hypothetical protein